ncbi:MAG: M48 family metallopeptidase [Crocinitomicaceae bacterium]|nr:M48 family metallopeptidase [Crocinitomicaceae bacterium]
MPTYKGLHGQIRSNNFRSALLLIGFPTIIIAAIWAVMIGMNNGVWDEYVQRDFLRVLPIALGAVGIWFLIAFLFHSQMIQYSVHSKPLERKENMRVYNLVENLCMSVGMKTPKIYIMETDALNAFASGLNDKTYAVTLTRGIINTLNDEELEGVIAHELAHIRNKDVKLLIISIIFVGIVGFIMQVAFRSVLYGGHNRRNNKQDGRLMLIILVVSAIAYLLTILFRFALSRKREYMADAGAVEMTKRPDALASALRKISGHSVVEDVRSDDVKGMFIENNPKETQSALSGLSGLFATHPPIQKRIAFLEQV